MPRLALAITVWVIAVNAAAVCRGLSPLQGGACTQDEVALVQRGADVRQAQEVSAGRDRASAEAGSAQGLIKQGWPWGEPDETSSLVLQLGHHNVGHVSSDREGHVPSDREYRQLHASAPPKKTKAPRLPKDKVDEGASLWSRIGALSGDIGGHVIFPEDDEGTGTLSGNSPFHSPRSRSSAAASGGHKVFVRRQWAVVKQNSYCASHRKALPFPSGRIRVPRCQELALQDSDCGDTIYSNGETDCYCVLAGNECELKTSSRANSVFRRLLPLAAQDEEPTLLRRWSRMRKKKRAAAQNERQRGPGHNSTGNSTAAESEEEAPPGMKLIAMPPALGARLRVISIIFFLTVPAIMTSWCVTNVIEKPS